MAFLTIPGGTRAARLRRHLRVAGALLLVAASLALSPPAPARAGAPVDDWTHVWQVVDALQARPPEGQVVYYLGDSTARESLVSDRSWTRQLARLAGRRVPGYTLAGHNQTFGMDLQVVRALPRSPGIALIGVCLSRFIGAPLTKERAQLPLWAARALSPWDRHQYDHRRPFGAARKKALVPHWLRQNLADFKRYRTANLAALGKVIEACQGRGLTPVLIDLPLNEAVVRHGLDVPRSSYRSGCHALASRLGIGYVSFLHALRLPSSAYFDICHLMRSGYTRWQLRLSRAVVKLL
jgi:hypothetical protein